MDYTSLLTNDAFLKLKCDSCKNCLSYFPICISGNKKNICGRCTAGLAEDSYARNEVYEALAQFLKFPCCYKNQGCLENFAPEDMPAHEKVCVFQLLKCPASQTAACDWEGPQSSSIHHCQTKHSDLMLKDAEFHLDLSQSYSRESFLKHHSSLLVVKEKFYSINKLMELSIYNHKHDVNFKEFTCEIQFKTSSRSVTVQCLVTAFEKRKIVEIFLDSLKDRDDSSSAIVGKVVFPDAVEDSPDVNIKIDESLLSVLKCSSCQEYALPPIYSSNSIDYKILCSSCKMINRSNQRNDREIREYGLEKVANLCNYPCRYKKSGCSFIGKPPQMQGHLNFCLYGTHGCPVNEYVACKWMGNGYEMVTHICKTHDAMILNTSTVTESLCQPNVFAGFCNGTTKFGNNTTKFGNNTTKFASNTTKSCTDITKCYIIKFSNQLFRLHFAARDQCYCWTVQMIGPFQNGYMFELEIIDVVNERNSLIIKRPCTSLTKKNELFVEEYRYFNNYCYFEQNQLANLVSNQQITFKVNIYEQEPLSLSPLNLDK